MSEKDDDNDDVYTYSFTSKPHKIISIQGVFFPKVNPVFPFCI